MSKKKPKLVKKDYVSTNRLAMQVQDRVKDLIQEKADEAMELEDEIKDLKTLLKILEDSILL